MRLIDWLTLCVAITACAAHASPPQAPSRPIQIGNFLADGGNWTTHVLMSPHLADADRRAIIDRSRQRGMNRIHIYGVNDDNYSRRRGGGMWPDIDDRALFYKPEDFDHWFHWFVECRKAGMHITLWLWPNDARQTYNNEKAWPDDRVVDEMRHLIALANTPWQGAPLVDEICLKLEGDDEWSTDRLNRIARRIKPMLHGQTLWHHNQTTDPKVLGALDWSVFDGIRIQTGHRVGDSPEWTDEALQDATQQIVDGLPSHLLIYFSEYTPSGFRNAHLGDALLKLRAQIGPRVLGVDNGATAARWLKPAGSNPQ